MSSYLSRPRTLEQARQESDSSLYYADLPQNMLFGALINGKEGTTDALKGEAYGFEDVRAANPTLDAIVKGLTLPAGPSTTYKVPEAQPGAVDFLAEVLIDPVNIPVAAVGKGLFNTARDLASENVDTLTASLPNFVPGYYGPNQVGAMAKWLATMGGPGAAKALLSPAGQALQKETGISATTQQVIKETLDTMDKAPLPGVKLTEKEIKAKKEGALAYSVGVAQAQHNVMTAHMFGSGKLAPELQRIKDLSYATDFTPISRESFLEGTKKMNVKRNGKKVYRDQEVLSDMYDVMTKQWASELGRADADNLPVDIIFKEPSGVSGQHLNDAMSVKAGYHIIQRVFDPSKQLSTAKKPGPGSLSYTTPDDLLKALTEASKRSKDPGSGIQVIKTTDKGVLVKSASLKSQSKLEGGVNHLMHVGLTGKVTHITSDYYDFADKLARKIGVEQFLNDKSKRGVLSVVVPMVTDARPEKFADEMINSRTGVAKLKGKGNKAKEKMTREDLEAVANVKPSEEGIKRQRQALGPFVEKGAGEAGMLGLLTADKEPEEER